MKVIGLLCWYDEDPAWLSSTIASWARTGLDELVAVDGPYALYPGGGLSPAAQYEAIATAAIAGGVEHVSFRAAAVWTGNEVEKRTAAFAAAQERAELGRDWYVSIDADMPLRDAPADLKRQLEQTDADVAEVTLVEPRAGHATEIQPLRLFYRALPGIRVETNHYTYVAGDGRRLWGNAAGGELVPALDLTSSVRVLHRTWARDRARHQAQYEYYRRRDAAGVERGPCARCGGPSTQSLPTGFERHPDGMVAGWGEYCDACAPAVTAENRRTVERHGYRLEQLQVRRGKLPA